MRVVAAFNTADGWARDVSAAWSGCVRESQAARSWPNFAKRIWLWDRTTITVRIIFRHGHASISARCVCRKLRPFDLVTESPNVSGDDRSVVLLPDPVRL